MRKRLRIVFALLLLAVIGGIAWLTLRPSEQEPVYQGKPLSAWLEAFGNADGGSITEPRQIEEAVRSIGTNAIPTLLRRLQAKDSPLTLWMVAMAQKQHVFKVKFTPAWNLQHEGVYGFEVLGADGKAAVPELMRMYEHDHSTEFQYLVTSALGFIGPAAAEAVPDLVRSLENTNLDYRFSAVTALGGIHSRPEIVVPALVKCLSDRDAGVRRFAVYAVAMFGSDAKPAVPDLLKLFADSDRKVIRAAKDALKEIDPEAAAKAGMK